MNHKDAGLRRRLSFRGLVEAPHPERGSPTQVHPKREGEEVFRRVRCRTHDACLTYAARKDWKGMSCARCPVVDEHDQHSEEVRNDMHGIADLLREAYPGKGRRRFIEPEVAFPTRDEMRAVIVPGILWSRNKRGVA